MIKKVLLSVALSMFAATSFAQDECTVDIEGNDQMQFNTKEISVPASCSEVTINLKHVGKLPKNTMGHGFVLTKTSDFMAVANAGMAAGLDNDHVPPGDDRVIMNVPIVGGGEENSVTFSTDGMEAGGDYTFFCPFPGHFATMQGKFKFG